MKEYKEFFEKNYDNPYNLDGSLKNNKSLGFYRITQILSDSEYSSLMIGKNKMDGNYYVIKEDETNIGSRLSVYRIDLDPENLKQETEGGK